MNMQPDLPWSVAGIPPEAREAARAAARREGLAVGEWLTRRILRSYTDATATNDMERAAWRSDVVEAVRNPAPEPVPARDTQEMLAHVSRTEGEAQNAYKNIDQQMKAVARRLETTERNQSENSRAMSKAATQINIAAREQAQAFDQLTGHVTGLADRLSRVERGTANDGMRDAVKGLHQGLARVADQVAQTANQSAQQIAALASTVEQLAGKLVEARSEGEAATQGYQQQVAALDERIRVVERTAYASASALDRTLEDVERMRAAKEAGIVETQRHTNVVADLSGQIDHLHQRVAAAEAQNAGAQARFEETARQLQTNAQDTSLDRRFAGIEHALSDIAGRIDMAERSSTQASGGVEQGMRDLTARLEAADRRNRDTIAELQTALKDANTKIAALEGNPVVGAVPVASPAAASPFAPAAQPSFAPAPQPPFAAPTPNFAAPMFDAPPFPEPAAAQPDGFEPPPFDHSPPPFATDGFAAAPPFGADAFAASAASAAGVAGNESFIAAARRSARTAAASEPAAPAGGFSWGFANRGDNNTAAAASAGGSRVRYALLAVVALIAIIVVAAALMLSRGMVAPVPNAPTSATSGPFAARPSITPPGKSDDEAPAGQNQTASTANTTNTTSPSPATPKPPAQPVHSASAPKAAPAKPVAIAQAPAAAPAAATPQSAADKLAAMANTGDAKSQLLLGVKYLDGNGVPVNEAEAARWLARAAQQGEPMAQYRLGTLYERGKGVPANAKQATHWYELAAKQGNRKAMHNLAVAFAEGSGEPKDYAQAATWFTRAANLGLADSQFNLAVLYERGMGVKQSLVDAYKWYAIAASQGDTESKARIDALSTQISDADRTAAQAAAASFKPQPINPAANSLPASAG